MKIDKSMFGDMAIKDLSPKDANSSGRIIKNLRICGSGLYEYHVSEAPLMGLTVPSDYAGDTFKIYRSAEVLEQNKDLYTRVPIITGHHVRVNTSNAKQLAVGMVGDTVNTEVGEDGELYLYTTGTIITGDGIEAYEKYGELSVGYDPIVEWAPGTYKNQPYQAVLKGFNEINHLLICKTARGGHQCMIMDSVDNSPLEHQNKRTIFNNINGGKPMGIFKKIFGTAPKTAMNGDAKVMSAILQSIKAGADCKTQVEAVKTMIGDSADETLKGYFEDLTGDEVAKATKEDIAKAVDVVDAYVQKLMGDSAPEPKAAEPKDKEAGDSEHPADCSCETCKGKKATGDAEPKPEEPKEKSNGDAISKAEGIDYDKLASMVAEKLKPAEPKPAEPKALSGDEVMEASRMTALLAGDSTDKVEVSSDTLMKSIWG